MEISIKEEICNSIYLKKMEIFSKLKYSSPINFFIQMPKSSFNNCFLILGNRDY